jgi:hypothetical protein
MFSPPISPATRNATSLPASAGGPMQLDLLAGLTTDPSGPAAPPASPSPSRGEARRKRTRAISGPSYSALSPPERPLSSWESRLRQRLARIGSTECVLTWKASATPSGRPLSRLVPSMRPIAEIACGLWPTPRANEGTGDKIPLGRTGGLALKQAVWDLWQTPVADDAVDRAKGKVNSRGEPKLSGQVVAMWPTPTSLAPAKGGNNEAGNSAGLVAIRGHAMAGLSELAEKPGALDPTFVAWLMGFPQAWLDCAPSSMPKPSKR